MEFGKWLWEKKGERTVKNLLKHGFDAQLLPDKKTAKEVILGMIQEFDSFGFAGSDTTRKLGLLENLLQMGKIVYDHWQEGLSSEESLEIRKMQSRVDCFLCSANAVSMTGEVVNVDGVGNRTNAMSFGPKKVVIVAGVNKIAKDLKHALERVQEIAAPMRSKSFGMDTPCVKTGICADCNSEQRICRITTILHRKPLLTDISVVLINQDLGY
jgi:LUD domain